MKKFKGLILVICLLIAVLPAQSQEIALIETYDSTYFHLRFNYPAGWSIREGSGGVQLLNYDYDNDGPNAPGEARMQFITAGDFAQLGLTINATDPVEYLNQLSPIFTRDETTLGEAAAITLGDYKAARADGLFRGNQTVYLVLSSPAGDLVFVTGEAQPDDFADFEALFLEIAATSLYAPPEFSDPLPVITAENAVNLARYSIFDTSDIYGGQTEHVAYSPDGTLVANAVGGNGVQIWNALSGELLHLNTDVNGRMVAFSPDNTYMAISSSSDGLQILDLTSRAVTLISPDEGVRSVAYSPDGTWLATGSDQGVVLLRDGITFEVAQTLAELGEIRINDLSFSPDGVYLAATSSQQILLWTIGNDAPPLEFTLAGENIRAIASLAFSQDGPRLAALANDGSYGVFAMPDGEVILSGSLGDAPFNPTIAFNSDGSLLATAAGEEGLIALIDVASSTTLALLNQGGDDVSSLAFSPDGTRLLAGGFYDDSLVIWAIKTEK